MAALLFLASVPGGCTVDAASSAAPTEDGAPTFADIAYLTNSGSNHEVPDNSCVCVETGNCANVIVEPVPGYFEQRNQVCGWNSSRAILDCTFEERFVRKFPPLAIPKDGEKTELPPFDEWPEVPGNWSTRKISAKTLRINDATLKWCILPTANNEG